MNWSSGGLLRHSSTQRLSTRHSTFNPPPPKLALEQAKLGEGVVHQHEVMTGLWDVVAAGRLRETASLLQRGGEQDTKRELHRMDMNGDNLLILAVRSSNPDLVQLLLDNGSQPDMRSRKTGCSALHEAVRLPPGIDTMRTLDLLVERGAYVNLRDKAVRVSPCCRADRPPAFFMKGITSMFCSP